MTAYDMSYYGIFTSSSCSSYYQFSSSRGMIIPSTVVYFTSMTMITILSFCLDKVRVIYFGLVRGYR